MIKTIRRSVIKGANWVLVGILSLSGFSGCNFIEYYKGDDGSSYATFSFRGTVCSEAGKPINNIQIEIEADGYDNITVLTDTLGRYSTLFQAQVFDNFQIIVSDIDGAENGSYLNDTVSVKIYKEDYEELEKSEWNYGWVNKEINIVLKEKIDAHETDTI
jgi:putative lipoprotein (rSAM/lipoprotein system)